jgi:DNA-binding GntR family transcriptional regulator
MSASAVTADERAYRALRVAIQSGHYPQGERLLEQALAVDLGLSRTPVRAALARLEFEGLVESDKHRGVCVSAWDNDDVADAFRLRALLEGWGASEAASRSMPNAQIVAELASLVETMEAIMGSRSSRAVELLVTLNEDFHETIAAASGNRCLVAIRRQLVSVPLVDRIYTAYTLDDQRDAVADHRHIYEAIRQGAPGEARQAMEAHVERGCRAVLASVSNETGTTP